MKNNTPQQLHQPVLLEQVISLLAPKKGESYLDLTAGYGGHAEAVLATTGEPKEIVLVDRDNDAIASLSSFAKRGATVMHCDFFSAAQKLHEQGRSFDMILLDLGVSSPQLDRAERGFSFKYAGPLDMRMDERETKTAAELVNHASEAELVQILSQFGEEPRARRVVKAIIEARPIQTTDELATVIAQTIRRGKSKIHPATRTFQAIRIAVNRELELLEATLKLLPELLAPEGRVVFISFHSLEDRLVKRFLQDHSEGYEADLKITTKKPISGATEDVHNPRARSAKLRAAVKINMKGAHIYAH
ncbi:MAG TPA: 16S rRNA (cytosine(1402)-N(4))-methyltransferase RsmH [Candidatus Saccharimonadales bacterium]|nr:16S rRNA (cytosine(1402)-N(4))-methyltransferase RsmH [Candidatus Saccharimonadales bacterium]